jgi:hypothetical protein
VHWLRLAAAAPPRMRSKNTLTTVILARRWFPISAIVAVQKVISTRRAVLITCICIPHRDMLIFRILPCALTTTLTTVGNDLLVAVIACPWNVNKNFGEALGKLFRSRLNGWTLGRLPRNSGKRLYTSREMFSISFSFIFLCSGF